MSFIVSRLQGLSPILVYVVVAALVFGETGLFVGFVLPGEAAVIVGGFIASRGHVSIALFCVVVFAAVVLGSSLGFLVGSLAGPRLLRLRILRRHERAIGRALDQLTRRGSTFVFVGRFTAFFRTVVPGLAGMSDMDFRRFTLANVASAALWGPGWGLVGYFAGNAYTKIEHYASYVGIGLAALVVALFVVHRIRARRRRDTEAADPEAIATFRRAAGEPDGPRDDAVRPVDTEAATPPPGDAGDVAP